MGARGGGGSLVPDERGVGGALEIAQDYRHFFSSRAVPRTRTAAAPPAAAASAERLSRQRAAKKATSDITAHEHLVRLQHLYRRVATHASHATGAARGQQQRQRAPQPHLRPSSAAQESLRPWVPRARPLQPASSVRRPGTAPERLSGADGSSSAQAPDWQQLKAAAHPTPRPPVEPVELPRSRFHAGPSPLPSVQRRLLRVSLMGEILRRQLYRAADIRGLVAQAVEAGPPEHRGTLREVAREVLQELDIPPGLDLDLPV